MSEVLICGDDPLSLQSLEALLREGGFRPSACTHLSAAVQPCLRGDCRLAIVALGYPDAAHMENRYEPIRLIREICPELPVVVVSDPEDLEAERELRSLGIFYLLTTPLSTAELSDVVRCAMRKRQNDTGS